MIMLKRKERKKIVLYIRQYALLFLGTAILAFGLYNIHSQSNITEGGVLGMELFLQHWFGISPSISGPVMDITCYLLGWKILGGSFLKNAIVASLGFSFFYSVNEKIGTILPNLGDYPLLAALAGGIFVGVGVGLIVRNGGASGGDDALALVINKVTRMKLAKCYFATDFVILMLSLTYIPLVKIVCSLITVSISSFIIGKIHEENGREEKNGKKEKKKDGKFPSVHKELAEGEQ